jgi:hypothetical protein
VICTERLAREIAFFLKNEVNQEHIILNLVNEHQYAFECRHQLKGEFRTNILVNENTEHIRQVNFSLLSIDYKY